MTEPAIALNALRKTYQVGFLGRKSVLALQGVSLEIAPGETIGLLGPNGAGKSTIIKLLLSLLEPSAGSVAVFGKSPKVAATRRWIGYLPENPAPYEYLTGREFVGLCSRLLGLRGAEAQAECSRVIEMTGMADAAKLQIRRYSKGMTQRICLAQALLGKPRVLVLDEPTSGLDLLGRQLVRDVITEEQKRGTTILLCSHIIPDVEALSSRVALIVAGQIIRAGEVSALLANDDTPVEVQVEGLTTLPDSLQGLERRTQGAKFVLRCKESEAQQVIQTLLNSGGRVIGVQRERFTLENLFLRAVQGSSTRVGSAMT